MEGWTGQWRWNRATAAFSDPLHQQLPREQVQEVVVRGSKLWMRNTKVAEDGSRRTWVFDGAFDGVPRPIHWEDGSVLTSIGFFLLDDCRAGDAYIAPGGAVVGSEHFLLDGDALKVWGALTFQGGHYPYFEEWERIG
jgi:hypothetical protein